MGNELISQVTTSAIVVYAIEWLKRSALVPWITAETKQVNRMLSALGALGGAAGIHAAFDATGGSLVITGLTLTGVAHGLWHAANQFALNQLSYDAILHKGKA